MEEAQKKAEALWVILEQHHTHQGRYPEIEDIRMPNTVYCVTGIYHKVHTQDVDGTSHHHHTIKPVVDLVEI
jgi:hypothetical protein